MVRQKLSVPVLGVLFWVIYSYEGFLAIQAQQNFSDDVVLPDNRCFVIEQRPSLANLPSNPRPPAYFQTSPTGRRQAMVGGRLVSLSRHHVIPFGLLRDFYNTVMDRERNNPMRPTTDGTEIFPFGRFLRLLAQDALATVNARDYDEMPGITDTRTTLREGVNAGYSIEVGDFQGVAHNDFGRPSVSRGVFVLQILYAWIPGNIVIGPGSRSDDPGNNFDDALRPIVGRQDYSRLLALNLHMTAYIDQTTYYDYLEGENDGRPTSLPRILTLLTDIVDEHPGFYEFNPDNWEFVNTVVTSSGETRDLFRVRPGQIQRRRRAIIQSSDRPSCLDLSKPAFDIMDIMNQVVKPRYSNA